MLVVASDVLLFYCSYAIMILLSIPWQSLPVRSWYEQHFLYRHCRPRRRLRSGGSDHHLGAPRKERGAGRQRRLTPTPIQPLRATPVDCSLIRANMASELARSAGYFRGIV